MTTKTKITAKGCGQIEITETDEQVRFHLFLNSLGTHTSKVWYPSSMVEGENAKYTLPESYRVCGFVRFNGVFLGLVRLEDNENVAGGRWQEVSA